MNKIDKLAMASLGIVLLAAAEPAAAFSIGDKAASQEKLEARSIALRILKENVPAQAFEKLTPEQTESVIKTALREASSSPADQVPGVVFLLLLGSVAVTPMVLRNRRFKDFQKTLQLMIEKGQTIPAALIENGADGRRETRDRRRGIFLLAFGAALAVALLVAKSSAWGISFIPIGIGAASLYLWKRPS